MPDDLKSLKIICEGGLNSSRNNIQLSDREPGGAWELINYEPGLFGGYRRLSGFQYYDENYAEVDSAGAEGKILGIAVYDGTIIAARKTQSASTYKFYKYDAVSGWVAYSTGLTLTATNVVKIRWAVFNFDGTEKIIFVDGVNNATLFDGTDWINIDPSGTGADYANSGGAQALASPSYVSVFENHIFMSHCANACHLVAHSAPYAEYDWTSSSGAGQIIAGFETNQIKPFREALYVFGKDKIKKITVDSSTFVINDVTQNIGCVASDSVLEIAGDLLFLSQDGFRRLAATDRIGDVELGTTSKKIQQLINEYIQDQDMAQLDSVLIRGKSQARFFFSGGNDAVEDSLGILGAIRGGPIPEFDSGSIVGWEWGKTLGIRTSCACSDYIGSVEYVLHGDHDGCVYRQEMGSSFNGANITSTYSTPYLDFGDVYVRKTLYKVKAFMRAEGDMYVNCSVDLDWGDPDVLDPGNYLLDSTGELSTYDSAIYGTDVYGGVQAPVLIKGLQGSGFSFQFTFTTNDTNEAHSFQGFGIEFGVNGRK